MNIKKNMKAIIMYKKGVIDCLHGVKNRSANQSYLSGYGRQYEREQVKTAVCHG